MDTLLKSNANSWLFAKILVYNCTDPIETLEFKYLIVKNTVSKLYMHNIRTIVIKCNFIFVNKTIHYLLVLLLFLK